MAEAMAETKTAISPLGYSALLSGTVALVAAVLHFWIGPLSEPPPVEESVAEIAVSIRDAVVSELRGEDYESSRSSARQWDADRVVDVGTVAAGLLAILLAVASFIRREDLRVAGSAAALGGGAIAFQFLAFALGIIVFAILVAAVLGALGISP